MAIGQQRYLSCSDNSGTPSRYIRQSLKLFCMEYLFIQYLLPIHSVVVLQSIWWQPLSHPRNIRCRCPVALKSANNNCQRNCCSSGPHVLTFIGRSLLNLILNTPVLFYRTMCNNNQRYRESRAQNVCLRLVASDKHLFKQWHWTVLTETNGYRENIKSITQNARPQSNVGTRWQAPFTWMTWFMQSSVDH